MLGKNFRDEEIDYCTILTSKVDHEQESSKTRPKVRMAPFSVYEEFLFWGIIGIGVYVVYLYFSGAGAIKIVGVVIGAVFWVPLHALFDWFFHPHPDDLKKAQEEEKKYYLPNVKKDVE